MQDEGGGRTTLASTNLQFDFDAGTGRFAIGRPGGPPILHDGTARARFKTLTSDTSALRVATVARRSIGGLHGPGEQLTIEFQPAADVALTLYVSLFHTSPFLSLRLSVENRSSQTLTLQQLTPLRTPNGAVRFGPASLPLTFFKNGYQSWSYAGILRADQRDINTRLGNYTRPMDFNPTTPIARQRGVFWSEMFGALIDSRTQQAIVAGQIGAADQFAQVFADTRAGQSALTLTCDLDDIPLAPGQSVASEEMFVALIDLPIEDPFADYFDAVARQMKPRRSNMPDAGWCSWYYYFGNVREEAVLANLQTARDWHESIPLGLIQIDDGYQAKTGDWLSTNGKFPHGMKWLADRIREAGRTPGLWLAPFVVVPSSQVAQRHPDWLIHDEAGRPIITGKGWNENCRGLDMTHPGACDYVRHVITTAVREWGYPYLKLDFLYAAAMQGKRHDPTLTRAQVLRRSLELIRETAGDDVFLLGCGCPLGPAIGLVDGMRIGPDTAPEPEPTWLPRHRGLSFFFEQEAGLPAARNAVRNVINRSAMHRKWWLNDPDCLIAREARHMNEIEVRSWASVVGLSGGMLLLSDDLPTLPLQRRRYLTAVMPPLGDAALPLDLFEREKPELYVLRQNRDWGSGVVAGLFNWDDRPRRKVIDLARLGLEPSRLHHAFEFWSGEYRRIEGGQIDLGELPAHGCAVVAIRPVLDRPHLVATTFHLTMGGEVDRFEIADFGLRIGVQLKRRAYGEVWIAGCGIHEARAGDRQIAIRQAAPGVWALPIEVAGSAQIELISQPTSQLTNQPTNQPAN